MQNGITQLKWETTGAQDCLIGAFHKLHKKQGQFWKSYTSNKRFSRVFMSP